MPSRIGRVLRIPFLPFIFAGNMIHGPQKHDHRRAVLEFPIKKKEPEALYTKYFFVSMHLGEDEMCVCMCLCVCERERDG